MTPDVAPVVEPTAPSRNALLMLTLCYPAVLALSYVLKPSPAVHAVFLAPHALIFTAFRMVPLRNWAPIVLTVSALDCLVMTGVLYGATGSPPELSYVLPISLANQLIAAGMVAASESMRRIGFLRRRFLVMMPVLVVALMIGTLPGVVLVVWLHALHGHLPMMAIDVTARVLGCVLGVVVCGPLLFGLLRGFREPAQQAAARGEVMAIVLAFIMLGVCLILLPWPLPDRFTELILVSLPLFWLAMRCSRRSVAIAIAALSTIIAFACAHGMGAFVPVVESGRWNDLVVSIQIFLLLIACEALLINRAMLERGALLERYRRKQSQLAAYAKALDEADESVRRAAAADLHDGVGQILAGQGLILGGMRRLAPAGSALGGMLDQALAASQEAQTAVRHTIQDLYPPELDGASIPQILASITTLFGTRYDFRVQWHIEGEVRLGRFQPQLLYRVIKELTYNAYKHARTDTVSVAVVPRSDDMEITVVDGGAGFGATRGDAPVGGFGLLSLTERVTAARGRLVIESAPGAGCRVMVWLPLLAEDAPAGGFTSSRSQEQPLTGYSAG